MGRRIKYPEKKNFNCMKTNFNTGRQCRKSDLKENKEVNENITISTDSVASITIIESIEHNQ